MSPKWLSFIDLLHVLAYPFLLWAAWMLHHRNSRDAVSSILSLAVLLTIGAEQPSSIFLAYIGVPRWLNVAIFDLGNVLLLAGILLFPHGNLSWRRRRPASRSLPIADVPARHALPDLLRLLHDRRRAVAAALPAADRIRASSGSRSAGRCSASPATRCCAAFRSSPIISNGRRAASATSCWSRCAPASASRSPCWCCSSAC